MFQLRFAFPIRPLSYVIVAACLIAVANGEPQGDDKAARAELLQTEIEQVADLLKMGQLDFAQAHLDLLESRFANEKAVIQYYRGLLDYHRGSHQLALNHFEALLRQQPETVAFEDIELYAFRAYCQLKQFTKAKLLLRRAERPWRQSAVVELGRAMYEYSETVNPERRQMLRDDCLSMLNSFVRQHPEHPSAAWVKFIEAERQYEKLEEFIARLTDAGAPGDANRRSNELLAQYRNRLLARYRYIRRHYPASPEAVKADFRIQYLLELAPSPTD